MKGKGLSPEATDLYFKESMLFQSLDDKEKCVGVYCDGRLSYDPDYTNLTKTWSYSPALKHEEIDYAFLYCGGKGLDEACPEHLKGDWAAISTKLHAFLISFKEAKVDLSENCFFDLVPQKFLMEFCEIRNQITKHVFENFTPPKNYRFLIELTKLIHDISLNDLKIDTILIRDRLAEFKVRQFYKKLKQIDPHIKYNIFGTKTGRLTTKKNSFPVLTMDKAYRGILKPNNDWFVEFDYNAAELRVLLGLLGKEQPEGDLHEWNAENVYKNTLSREDAKKRIFAWLYNPSSKDSQSDGTYDRNSVVNKYFNGSYINTYFDRKIPADKHHALNYIVQSTTSDLILRQAIKLNELLAEKKTKIAFMIHDSIVLDMAAEDEEMINILYKTFAKTEFGTFATTAKAGKNFGDLKKLWIHL